MSAPDTTIPHAPVAIVMRTQERPLLLRRAIRDVTRQGYQTWHLVVVNDGGDEATVDGIVADHTAALAGRITVIHNEEPRGAEAASNQAIRASSSPFICIHDDDDTWHPDFLGRTVAYLEGSSDAGVAVRTEIVWEEVKGQDIVEVGREIFGEDIHEFTLFELIRHNRVVPISMLYRRSVHDEIGYYREDIVAVGDWEFNLRLAVGHQMGFLTGEPLAFWHQRREQGGPLGNSVISRSRDHRKFDLLVRNAALQEHVRQQGMGSLLYMTKFVDREIGQFHDRITFGEARQEEVIGLLREQNERIRALEEAISDASLVSLVRRRYRRLKGRLVDSRSRR